MLGSLIMINRIMPKSIPINKIRRRRPGAGRPPVGPFVGARLPQELIEPSLILHAVSSRLFFRSGRSSSRRSLPASISGWLRGSGHDGCRTRGQATADATELQHWPLICGGLACLVGDRPASSRYVDPDSSLRNDFCSKTFRSRHKSTPPDRILKMIAPLEAVGERQ